jgi:S-adenosylmethionine:tRNA ribosyltransferase-isomerase
VTHAAGLSSTGRDALDRRLPLNERFSVPEATVRAIAENGGRVVAVGTTVVRALESAARTGTLVAGTGIATLRIDESYAPRVVHSVLSGMHEPGTSHFELLSAFAAPELLTRASAHASEVGYLTH